MEAGSLTELSAGKTVVGVRQTRKAVREGRAKRVYLACDADPAVTDPAAAECEAAGVPLITDFTMGQLGRACRVPVGASAVAVVS